MQKLSTTFPTRQIFLQISFLVDPVLIIISRAKDVQNFDKKLLSKDFVTFFLYFRLKSDQKNQKHRKKIGKHSSYHWVEKIISNTLIDHSSSVVGCFKKRHLIVTKSLMQSGINVMLINEK